MLQSALPLAVLIAVTGLALFRPVPAQVRARKCVARRRRR
jgi:cytochrome b subunit of formate dehydrogenase